MEPQKPCPGCGFLPPGHASACPLEQQTTTAKRLAAELVGLMKTLGVAWLVIGSVYLLCGSLCYSSTMIEGAEFADAVQFGSIVTIGIGVLHAILGGLFWQRDLPVMGSSLCVAMLMAILCILLGMLVPWLFLPALAVYVLLVIVTISATTKQNHIAKLPGGQEALASITEATKPGPIESTKRPG